MFQPRKIMVGLILALFLVLGSALQAQGRASYVAFINSSGQLVVASGDGGFRWIVTNPGETLAQPLGFTWSPNGRRVFFAVDFGGTISLRVAEVNSQSAVEIGQVSAPASGGDWSPDGGNILIASNGAVLLFPANGGNAANYGGAATLISPFAADRPNIPVAHSLSPNGQVALFQSGGQYGLLALANGSTTTLPGTNDPTAPQSGLWSDNGGLVAYWGFDGSSILSVTSADSGQTATLNSGRSVPITPLAWQPSSTWLVYRDASSIVKVADLSCVSGGCGANPLENGVDLLPATASDVQFSRSAEWVFFRDGSAINAVHLGCVSSGNCLNSAMTLGQNAAPRTWLHVGGSTLVYTAYTQDPNNPNDREVRAVDLGCLGNPSNCQPVSLLGQAVAGLVSPDGAYVVVDQAGNGIQALNIASLTLNYLSDSLGGQLGTGLNWARWG